MPRLEKWSLVGATKVKPLALRGEIHGDERFSNGTPITSSRLHHLDPDGHFGCTKNGTYELGAISDAFARWMASSGRTLAAYAQALDPSAARARSLKVVPARPTSAPTRVATRSASANGVATALVATPTVLVARA